MFSPSSSDGVGELTAAFRLLSLSNIPAQLPAVDVRTSHFQREVNIAPNNPQLYSSYQPSLHPYSTVDHASDPEVSSNFSQLPMDILYALFTFMKPTDAEESLQSIVVASHVCRRWRSVAIGAPLLWTHVRMSWIRDPSYAETISTILNRSRDLPLSLQFILKGSTRIQPSQVHHWIKLVYYHAHRVHKLDLVVRSMVDHRPALRMMFAFLKFPSTTRFNLDIQGPNRTDFVVTVKPREHGQNLVEVPPKTMRSPIHPTFHHLDWIGPHFQITSLSLKCVVVLARDLHAVLTMCRKTLVHLEYYASHCLQDWARNVSFTTLPLLTSLCIGYSCVDPAYWLVSRLKLPSLTSVFVHDFRRCPQPGLPVPRPEKISPDLTDAQDLLWKLLRFPTITSLTLRGVECFTSSLEDVTEIFSNLIQGLESLELIKCDAQFLHALHCVTMESPRSHLEKLSQLTITCYNYEFVLEHLKLRTVRGLPRLTKLSVNSRMAILRHFIREHVIDFHVRGVTRRQRARQVDSASHPYLRHPLPRRVPNRICGLHPRQECSSD